MVDEHKSTSSTPGFPCSRGDIFLKLGMRGARLIPWRLREGDVFRLGQAYVLVAKVRSAADVAMDVSALSPFDEDAAAAEKAASAAAAEEGDDTDDEGGKEDEAGPPRAYPPRLVALSPNHAAVCFVSDCSVFSASNTQT